MVLIVSNISLGRGFSLYNLNDVLLLWLLHTLGLIFDFHEFAKVTDCERIISLQQLSTKSNN